MRLKSSVFYVFFALNSNFLINAMEEGEPGVCVTHISVRKTRTKYITLNKKCGKKKCVEKKIEVYSEPQKRLLCCTGWGYEPNTNTCEPVCSTGCKDGKCTAPEVCTCEHPYTLDTDTRNVCLPPTCEPPCVNGICVDQNKCKCNSGYYQYNATVCAECEDGYQMIHNNCEPICDEPCSNGYCSAPNVCTCNEGYEMKNSNCEPICDCVNAVCVAPNVCECKEGFLMVKKNVCVPVCDNCPGECIAPNVCKCPEGLSYIHSKCSPMCEVPCENGHCLDPNVCVCNEGYVKDETDPHTCVRDCTKPAVKVMREQPTKSIRFEKHRRSTCPPKTTVCTPEEEKRLSGFNHNLHLCCAKPTGPIKTRSLTICCDGWVYENDTCKPICRRGCINGYCASPGVCKCNPSLVLIDDNTCGEPTCDPPCFNAACTDNNVCSCFASHISYNKTHCVPQCEPGLFIDFISLTCEPPTCDSPCENGECTAPGVCTCNEGYTNLNDSTCIPICEPNCVNGICISPNTCSCEIGYESKNKTYCAPKCEACENGECVAPNQCECKVGYSKKDSDKCTPDCNKECVNATCVSPNKCVCASGYEPTDDDAVCKPKCYACKHGDCIAPLNCQCHDGYFRGVGGCIPECPEPCVNGKCTSPNICTCDDGYMKNSTHATVCFKPCEGLCEYGKCSLHGECICDRGYELRNGSCFSLIPVECSGCEYNCTFGECFCSNNTPCTMDFGVEGGLTRTEKTTSLAGLELTWILCGIVMLLLVVIVVLVMQAIWQRRKQFEKTQRCEGNTYSSVLFTTSDTLMQKKIPEEIPEEEVTLGSQSSETITIEKQQQSQLS